MAKWKPVPTRLPPPMYVCVCNGVTERDIRQAVKSGCRSIAELTMRTGCGATCGSCLPQACELLDQVRGEHSPDGNVVAFPGVAHAA